MSEILVDTSVWFALVHQFDQHDARAHEILALPGRSAITVWPVVWETVTLLVARAAPQLAAEVGRRFIRGELGDLVQPTTSDGLLALRLLEHYPHLRLSAADALCCTIARRLNIPEVASFDAHFRQILTERTVMGSE